MVGAPVIRGSSREPWGFDVVDAPWKGSGYVTIDWGDPDVPEGNLAPAKDAGGHWEVPLADVTVEMSTSFLETGVIPMPCDEECDPD